MQRNLEKQLKWLRLEEAKTGDAENNKEVDEVGFQYVRRQEGVQASGQVEAARLSTRERRYDLEISITWICVLVLDRTIFVFQCEQLDAFLPHITLSHVRPHLNYQQPTSFFLTGPSFSS